MNLQEQRDLSHEHYGLLFSVRLSIRYHDRRKMFFERLHQLTAALTILTSGSVIFDLASGSGQPPPWWLTALAIAAATSSVLDLVVGFSQCANLHDKIKRSFSELEVAMVTGSSDEATWSAHQVRRLKIEQDEPPIYRALNDLCHNEQMRADGHPADSEHFAQIPWHQKHFAHFWHWPDVREKKPTAKA